MTQLERYIDRYGPKAGAKIYRTIRSRAGYLGTSRRRGREIAEITGRPMTVGRANPPAVSAPGMLPFGHDGADEASSLV